MTLRAKILIVVLAFAPVPAVAAEPNLSCEVGPLHRHFGASEWLIYSCADSRSIVVVPASGSPGKFGYFFVMPEGSGIMVVGEGWGRDTEFQPLLKELQRLSARDLAALVASTKSAAPPK